MNQWRLLGLWRAMEQTSGRRERPCELVRDQELQIRMGGLPRIVERQVEMAGMTIY
jgi:hypothetical protein